MVSEVAGLNKHTHTIMHTITGYSYKPMAVTLHSFVEGQHIQKQNGHLLNEIMVILNQQGLVRGDYTIFLRNLHIFFCTCHNSFPLSFLQIIIIPACCLLCVL